MSSVASPRLQPGAKHRGKGGAAHYDPPAKNRSWQQSSFLTKANSKSLNSSSMLNQKGAEAASTDMQKLLKNFIKQVATKQE